MVVFHSNDIAIFIITDVDFFIKYIIYLNNVPLNNIDGEISVTASQTIDQSLQSPGLYVFNSLIMTEVQLCYNLHERRQSAKKQIMAELTTKISTPHIYMYAPGQMPEIIC